MSDYVAKTAVRVLVFRYDREWYKPIKILFKNKGFEERFPGFTMDDLFDIEFNKYMEVQCHARYLDDKYQYSCYLEFILEETYGEENSDYAIPHDISDYLAEKVLPYFKEFDKYITKEDLELWAYSYYNSTEPDDFRVEDVIDFQEKCESLLDKRIRELK